MHIYMNLKPNTKSLQIASKGLERSSFLKNQRQEIAKYTPKNP
jgi:hypothetical protein